MSCGEPFYPSLQCHTESFWTVIADTAVLPMPNDGFMKLSTKYWRKPLLRLRNGPPSRAPFLMDGVSAHFAARAARIDTNQDTSFRQDFVGTLKGGADAYSNAWSCAPHSAFR
jgi:hypothetical protein